MFESLLQAKGWVRRRGWGFIQTEFQPYDPCIKINARCDKALRFLWQIHEAARVGWRRLAKTCQPVAPFLGRAHLRAVAEQPGHAVHQAGCDFQSFARKDDACQWRQLHAVGQAEPIKVRPGFV